MPAFYWFEKTQLSSTVLISVIKFSRRFEYFFVDSGAVNRRVVPLFATN